MNPTLPTDPKTGQPLDQTVVNFAKAIRQHESAGKYDIKGKSGEYGAYQFMPARWKGMAKQYLGNENADINDPVSQDKVAYYAIKDQKDQGHTPEEIASWWNSGKYDPNETGSDTNSMGVKYDVPGYVKAVISNFQKIKSENPVANETTQQENPDLAQLPEQPVDSRDTYQKAIDYVGDPMKAKDYSAATAPGLMKDLGTSYTSPDYTIKSTGQKIAGQTFTPQGVGPGDLPQIYGEAAKDIPRIAVNTAKGAYNWLVKPTLQLPETLAGIYNQAKGLHNDVTGLDAAGNKIGTSQGYLDHNGVFHPGENFTQYGNAKGSAGLIVQATNQNIGDLVYGAAGKAKNKVEQVLTNPLSTLDDIHRMTVEHPLETAFLVKQAFDFAKKVTSPNEGEISSASRQQLHNNTDMESFERSVQSGDVPKESFFTDRQKIPLDKISDAQGMTLDDIKAQANLTKNGLLSSDNAANLDEGAFHGARLGRPITEPISVIQNPDGTFDVPDGLHRLRQAVINGDSSIIAKVESGAGSLGDTVLRPEVAQGRITDIAANLEKIKPGSGAEFAAKVNPNSTTLNELQSTIDSTIGEQGTFQGLKEGVQSGLNKLDRGVQETASIATTPATAAKESITKWIGEVAESKYVDRVRSILKLTPKQIQLEERYAKDTPDFLVKEGVAGDLQSDGKTLDTTQARAKLATKSAAENEAFNKILETDPRYISLEQAEADAVSAAKDRFIGTDQTKAVTKIQNEFSAYKEQFGDPELTNAKGEMLVTSADMNTIKQDLWSKTKAFGTPDAQLENSTSYLMGDAAKNSIEVAYKGDVPIQSLNQRLGNFAAADKILASRNGIKLPGGMLARFGGRVTGAVAGSLVPGGGLTGEFIGGVVGGKLAEWLQDPQISTYAARAILEKLGTVKGGESIIAEAERILGMKAAEAINMKLLPAPRYTPMGPSIPESGVVTPPKAGGLYEYQKGLEASQKAALGKYAPPPRTGN